MPESSPPSSPRTRFARDTGVEPLGGGRFGAVIDPSWWIVAGPNGGYVAAVVLRAVLAEVDDPERRARSITLQYLRPPAEGAVEVEVVVERAGRNVTSLSARMRQGDRLLVVALVTVAVTRDASVGFDETPGLPLRPDGTPVPMVEHVPAIEVDPDRDVPMRSHYDLRWVLGELPFRGASRSDGAGVPRAVSGGWLRPAEAEPVDEVVLLAMADAWMPAVFSRLDRPVGVPTVDLTVHFRRRPGDPLEHCFVLFDSPLAAEGYLVENGRIWDRAGRLLAESRQLAMLS